MQQIAGALGYTTAGFVGGGPSSRGGGIGSNGSTTSTPCHQGAAVLVSPPSMELTDRMYADLIDSLRYSRDNAERRASDAERRLRALEARLEELYCRLLPTTVVVNPSVSEREVNDATC